MDALPDALLAIVLAALPLDERCRCAVLSRRFARLVREAPHTRYLSFGGVPRRRRCAVDGGALSALCGRGASTLTRVDLSALPPPPRGALSPVDAVAALQRGAPPGALREARVWHAGAPQGAQRAVAQPLCAAAVHARTPAPLVALLAGHARSAVGAMDFTHALACVLCDAATAGIAAGASRLVAGAEAADDAAAAGAAPALLAALAAHAHDRAVTYQCLVALTLLARWKPEHVARGAPRAAAVAAALRCVREWTHAGDDRCPAIVVLKLFAPVPAPEALDAVLAVMARTASVALLDEALCFVSAQRACAEVHAHDSRALALALRALEEDLLPLPRAQSRLRAVLAVDDLVEARRRGARRGRGAPAPPPHPCAPRLLAAAVAALRPRAGVDDAECAVMALSVAEQLLTRLLAAEGVTIADARAAGALHAVTAALLAFGDSFTDHSAPIWCRVSRLLCRLLVVPHHDAEVPVATAAAIAAHRARAAAAVAAGVHAAALDAAAAAARRGDAALLDAACFLLTVLADAISEEDVVRPGGVLDAAALVWAAQQQAAVADAGATTRVYSTHEEGTRGPPSAQQQPLPTVASMLLQRLAARRARCAARADELLGVHTVASESSSGQLLAAAAGGHCSLRAAAECAARVPAGPPTALPPPQTLPPDGTGVAEALLGALAPSAARTDGGGAGAGAGSSEGGMQ
jgi:hypothetical protein